MATVPPRLTLGLCVLAVGFQTASAQVSPEISQSVEMLTTQAEAGDPEAQFGLGLYFQYSKPLLDGSQVDYSRAVDLYERAAAQGHAGASFALARLYDQGLGVERDIYRAIELYTVAADEGHAEAMGWLGAAHFEIGDFTFAYIWSSQAAELGDPGGLNNLGAIYHSGLGAERDYGRAMDLYRQSAEKGDCIALMNIGGLYYNGDGVPQDGSEAERWFQAARNCESDDSAFIVDYSGKYSEYIQSGEMPEPLPDGRPGTAEALIGAAVIAAIVAAAAAGESSGNGVGTYDDSGSDWRDGWNDAMNDWGMSILMDD